MSEQPREGTVWRATLEQLPPDSRGFRRTLRLHAVAFQGSQPAPQAICGYQPQPGELRAERDWETVTDSGRCTLCDLQLRRAADAGVELVESVDLDERGRPAGKAGKQRLSLVSDEAERQLPSERRSTDRRRH